MRDELLNIASKIDNMNSNMNGNINFNKNNDSIMKDFIVNKMSKDDIIKNMDIIMRYTSFNNLDYFNNTSLIGNMDFFESVKKNIDKFRYTDRIGAIFDLLENNFTKDDIYTDDFIEKLIDLNLNSSSFWAVFFRIPDDKLYYFLDVCRSKNKYIKDIIRLCIKGAKKPFYDFLYSHMELCAKETDIPYVLKDFVKDNKEYLDIINYEIDNNPDRTLKSFLDYNSINDDVYYDFIKIVVEEICNNEKVKLSDIEFLGSGSYSSVYSIGNKVLKIGLLRETESFVDNPYIVKPILRRKIENDDFGFFVEVTEKVDTYNENDPKKIFDDIYDLYKKIRNYGLIWADCFKDNIGVLSKDNVIYWKDNIDPSSSSLNLEESDYKKIVLKKGDLVLLDADFLYDEHTYDNKEWPEIRFKKELNFLMRLIKNLDPYSKLFDTVVSNQGFRPDYIRKKLLERKKAKILK